jgi:FkbM family methyltransferase
MPFVTYAQNFEDLMLSRALSGIEHGFYIDAGANDPRDESVTKVFYDRGWSGINIEPDPVPFARLVAERPRDVNLNVGVWSSCEDRTFHVVEDCSALSTVSDYLREEHQNAGRPMRSVTIPMLDLKTICERHAGTKDIHFLKVDVEGSEREVFMGHDFDRWRPWIILFEAHGPDPLSTYHVPAEERILQGGYRYVYCDGVNRFYLDAQKFDALKSAFIVPPNFYDDWYRFRDIRFLPKEALPAGVKF